ncbi:glycogen debranching protein GlgX [Humibacter ginsenosidimutans]|uniref:Glycogen debranching protein GlgX n=1 Tax=Humibacter ginsenosidimutans TaxID=2599293 RepID=A0A5B8M1B7_9MICO|nr:glycogen debranching protein GlgX [Humibacter ginsenosidimutans]QDZ14066.1 glycogen debranching protein GlgX [Humibacter ginsenosidimutans]
MSSQDPLSSLGVHAQPDGGSIGVYSASATGVELLVFDADDPNWLSERVPLDAGDDHVWTARSEHLRPGARYSIRCSGPTGPEHHFDERAALIEPYSRGLLRSGTGWRSVVVDGGFDWGGVAKPHVPRDHTVVYEAHVKGLTALNPDIPTELRGTYAGMAHPATIEHLKRLGVTSVELLPVHAFVSEQRLSRLGLTNYWGYNTLNFFTPHAPYATKQAQAAGADAVLREFKGMVRLLHEAGLEVILDVVYNHTAEEGENGPTTSLRGIDNATYYRMNADGSYIDTTGVGNTVNFGEHAARRLVLDSLRYWANDVQIDGFRFDLAVTLGRDETGAFDNDHALLTAITDDPYLEGVKLIAEPWDIGPDGWHTGGFPDGWSEWNDRYRNRVRSFWLRDIADARANGSAPTGIGSLATRLAGSSNLFSPERGPLASVNFVTAHDGFTLADLVAYDQKHNLGNGESNRDGTDDNRSFNHGVEGQTDDEGVLAARRKAARNLMGTLLLSAGIPMITAGDEYGRTQSGNNNAYCHDDDLTWYRWDWDERQHDFAAITAQLIRLRSENPALRPVRFGKFGESVPSASQLDWYDAGGGTMDEQDWDSPQNRTLQFLAASTPEFEEANRILLVLHGLESETVVTLPSHAEVGGYTLLWDSAEETVAEGTSEFAPGNAVPMGPTSMKLFRAHD